MVFLPTITIVPLLWFRRTSGIVGGVLLGVLELLTAAYVSSVYKDVVAFLVLVGALLVLPHGLFGERVGERA